MTLWWSLTESTAPVDGYTLNITSVPPDPTLTTIIFTNNTAIKVSLFNREIVYNVEITVENCFDSTTVNYTIEGKLVQAQLDIVWYHCAIQSIDAAIWLNSRLLAQQLL